MLFTYLFAQLLGQMMGHPGPGWMAMESAMDWRTIGCPGLGWIGMEFAMDWRTFGYVVHRGAFMPAMVFVLR